MPLAKQICSQIPSSPPASQPTLFVIFLFVSALWLGPDTAEHKIIEKSCKGVKDPVVAARQVRKNTLKLFNQVTTRIDAAITECRSALDALWHDFDSEDCPTAEFESVRLFDSLLSVTSSVQYSRVIGFDYVIHD